MSTVEERTLDKRVVERSIRRGLLSKEDYARYIERLSDVTENAGYVAYGEEEIPEDPQ
jgi:hypothetical protein